MKKLLKPVKLGLQKETIRQLTSVELTTVAGGGSSAQTIIISKCTVEPSADCNTGGGPTTTQM